MLIKCVNYGGGGDSGTSLVVQWLRIHLAMQGIQVQPLIEEIRSHYSLPGSSVQGILQPRIVEWVAISFSRGSS